MAATFLAAMALGARPAHANFVFFDIPGVHPGQRARVAEQIVCANPGCTGLDYQFYVLNTGLVPIDGVAFGLGVVNAAAQINGGAPANLGGTLTFATAPGGGDGPFPNAIAGNFGGTAVLGIPPTGISWGGPFGWGFEEWQDGALGGLPASFYIVRWFSPVQGPFAVKLLPGRYTRLDLFTVFGPVGGSGAIDPPIPTDIFFGIDTTTGNFEQLAQQDLLDAWDTPCDPLVATCTDTPDPTGDSFFRDATLQTEQEFLASIPEPGSIVLMFGGCLAIFAGKKIKSRRSA